MFKEYKDLSETQKEEAQLLFPEDYEERVYKTDCLYIVLSAK